jgi:hypothetical protein
MLSCEKCGASYRDGDDGYCGLCPSCADAEEENVEYSYCDYCDNAPGYRIVVTSSGMEAVICESCDNKIGGAATIP